MMRILCAFARPDNGGQCWTTTERTDRQAGRGSRLDHTRDTSRQYGYAFGVSLAPLPLQLLLSGCPARKRICRQNNKQFASSRANKGPQRIKRRKNRRQWEREREGRVAKNSSFSCTYESKFPLDTDFEQPLLCVGFNRELARERGEWNERVSIGCQEGAAR